MSTSRERIIVNYKDITFKNHIKKNNVNIIYESKKENYAIIYCDKQDVSSILDSLKRNNFVIDAYISNERIGNFNF